MQNYQRNGIDIVHLEVIGVGDDHQVATFSGSVIGRQEEAESLGITTTGFYVERAAECCTAHGPTFHSESNSFNSDLSFSGPFKTVEAAYADAWDSKFWPENAESLDRRSIAGAIGNLDYNQQVRALTTFLHYADKADFSDIYGAFVEAGHLSITGYEVV